MRYILWIIIIYLDIKSALDKNIILNCSRSLSVGQSCNQFHDRWIISSITIKDCLKNHKKNNSIVTTEKKEEIDNAR